MTAYSLYRRIMTRVADVDIVITLKMRKTCVIPHGTVPQSASCTFTKRILFALTVSEIFQVDQLVIPLCYDSNSIFDECDNDEKATDRRKIPINTVSAWDRHTTGTVYHKRYCNIELCWRNVAGCLTVSKVLPEHSGHLQSCSFVLVFDLMDSDRS